MRIDDLKLFIKVADLGGFSAAANALDLPRANVSRRINQLEHALQAPLFHRTTRSFSLTNQGEVYYFECTKALAILDNVHHAVSLDAEAIKGKVKLGILAETHVLLQPILFDFMDRYPDVELDIRVISNGFIEMDQQGLDIAFHGGKLIDSDIVARQLMSLDRCVVASQSYLHKCGEPKEVKELRQHQALCFRWPNGKVDLDWHLAESSVTVETKLVSNSVAFLKESAVAGRGLAFLPKALVLKELTEGQLVTVLENAAAKEEHAYVLYRRSKTLNVACRKLLDFLFEEFPKRYTLD